MKLLVLLFKITLFPLYGLYYGIIFLRNYLYDSGISKSIRPKVYTINVGNLSLGGTGKTPHVEYLVRLLNKKYQMSTLSRGYGRQTKGFLVADNQANAQIIGDEPMQYYLKFAQEIKVVVCEDRVEGVNKIQTEFTDNKLVVLDDVFQHRKINPHLNLLLTEFDQPFFEDALVPFGRLRDIRQSARRADAVIVTKCPPQLSQNKRNDLEFSIKKYTDSQIPIFYSSIIYRSIVGYIPTSTFELNQQCVVVSAIAKPEKFVEYLKTQVPKIQKTIDFPDHYAFLRDDIEKLLKDFGTNSQFISTEKDMVKIKPLLSKTEQEKFFYVPIEVNIVGKSNFDDFILQAIQTY
ncbi:MULTISPECIES: tetraacyldisaccharide 4'-kinase [Emticicia]|uniref:tetraacyldisaccharide 4'-kinase n=1 Tax=Emticicia TaxID=312278 RepID=UPI0007D89960|nr:MULTISPECIES: tetraacyldisaccharide 4'-kinase [Emticicia]